MIAKMRARRAREDAQQNRTHLLAVAERYYTEEGLAGSMSDVAKRAGVGKGTLYRHFPTRDALLAALLRTPDAALAARREAIRQEARDATDALTLWLDAVVEWVTTFDGLPEPLRAAATEGGSPLALACQRIITITDDFLCAAQRDGSARPAVRARDLFLTALAMGWVRTAALADASSVAALHAMLHAGWATPARSTDAWA